MHSKFTEENYLGNRSQLFRVQESSVIGGKANGFRMVDMWNETGLHISILQDRAMDIGYFSYKGINFSYHSPSGLVAPQYFHSHEDGFARNWYGGLITTCGLTFAGIPCNDNGDRLPLHGLIDNIPASATFAGVEYEDGYAVMVARGEMAQAVQGGENLLLKREIRCGAQKKSIKLSDSVTNLGITAQPLMLIYHCNLGYPLLAEGSYALFASKSTQGRTENSKRDLDSCRLFIQPQQEYEEQSFYHTMLGDANGNTLAAIINPRLSLGLALQYNLSQCKMTTQVKLMQAGAYMATIEPGNCGVEGRKAERELGRLEMIQSGETRRFGLEIEVLDGVEEIHTFEERIRKLCS